jgi:Ser/Thr protein kinase RdoA (MazF antagonist)
VAAAVEFLPVGDDSRAWSFRVVTGDGARWFVKVRRGRVDPATVLGPRFLRDRGLEQMVAAVPAADGDPSRPLDGFTLLLYPWVDGVPAMERGLTDRAVRLGRVVAAARPELVLCHADLYLANLLVGSGDRLRVVDWDGLQLAPRDGWRGSWPTTAVVSSTTSSATTRGATPWRSSGGCSRPGTWSRRLGWPTGG